MSSYIECDSRDFCDAQSEELSEAQDEIKRLETLLRAAMANHPPPPEGCEWVAVCKTCWCDPEHAGRCRDRECPLRASPGRGK